jgi:mannonate dehydratase
LGRYGGGGFIPADEAGQPKNGWVDSTSGSPAEVFDDEEYLENIPKMFAYLRAKLGYKPKLIHDVHEHLRPTNAVTLAKLLEPYRLFFLEDALPPEQIGWYRLIRQQCATPQAMGELFTNPQEWLPLISERLIDYLRVRVSKVGGITPARKIAALAESFGVNMAFQEGSTDPVNQMASVHLDMAVWNLGAQEENHFRPEEYDLFPGHTLLEGGYLYPNDKPGLGMDIDEDQAKRLLDGEAIHRRKYQVLEDRRADGTLVRP